MCDHLLPEFLNHGIHTGSIEQLTAEGTRFR